MLYNELKKLIEFWNTDGKGILRKFIISAKVCEIEKDYESFWTKFKALEDTFDQLKSLNFSSCLAEIDCLNEQYLNKKHSIENNLKIIENAYDSLDKKCLELKQTNHDLNEAIIKNNELIKEKPLLFDDLNKQNNSISNEINKIKEKIFVRKKYCRFTKWDWCSPKKIRRV